MRRLAFAGSAGTFVSFGTAILNRLEKSRIDKDLRMAAEVQRALLAQARHATPFCEAVGDSIACRAIGGDFFEIVDLPPDNLGIALGDVAGKGPASALLAAMIQGMFSVEARSEPSPAKVLVRLNCSLAQRRLEPRFATLVYGILSGDGRLLYSLAGHNPPILLAHDRSHRLATGGPVLGAFSESVFPEETVQLREGDSVIMFSEGVTEARDAHGEEFGEERLIGWLTANGARPPADLLNGILKRVQDFGQGSPPTDDVTVTVTRFGSS